MLRKKLRLRSSRVNSLRLVADLAVEVDWALEVHSAVEVVSAIKVVSALEEPFAFEVDLALLFSDGLFKDLNPSIINGNK